MPVKMTEQEIEDNIEDIAASFAMEDMILTEETRRDCEQIVRGEITADELVEEYKSQLKGK